jgi:hypothetical protein
MMDHWANTAAQSFARADGRFPDMSVAAAQTDPSLERELLPEPDFDAEGQSELASLQTDFPAFEIWLEETGYGTLYVARSRTLGVHPHTVVTADPASIRAALADPTPPQPGNGGVALSGPTR